MRSLRPKAPNSLLETVQIIKGQAGIKTQLDVQIKGLGLLTTNYTTHPMALERGRVCVCVSGLPRYILWLFSSVSPGWEPLGARQAVCISLSWFPWGPRGTPWSGTQP